MNEAEAGAETRPPSVTLWDPIVRAFHWLLVGFFATSMYLGHFGPGDMSYHFWSGYAIAGLIVLRLIWGLFGPRPARLSSLIHGPRAIFGYLSRFGRRSPSHYPGHNPIGSLSVIAMLLLLSAQIFTGLFADPEDYLNYGPLADMVEAETNQAASGWHERIGNLLLVLVAMHVSVILFYRIWKREDLVSPMIKGGKVVEDRDAG